LNERKPKQALHVHKTYSNTVIN